MYVDVHCHIPKDTFPNYQDFLDRAQAAGVKRVIVNGMFDADNKEIHTWQHEILRIAYGLHPCYEHKDTDQTIEWIKQQNPLAIGEIGLDKHWKPETFQTQLEIFVKMLKLSNDMKLPVIIHSRKAEAEVLQQVKEHKQPIILHAFGGKKSLIKQGVEQKCYFSITSNIKRSDQVQQLVKLVPLGQLLTETDAPYMSKTKDIPSESKDVVDTVQEIARIKKITPEECKLQLFMNYQTVFKD